MNKLKDQIKTETTLIELISKYEQEIQNKVMKHLIKIYRLDSRRHISILQAAIEIMQGEDLFIEDRAPLASILNKHLKLEKKGLNNLRSILNKLWVEENKGLKGLLHLWRDDEHRHHKEINELITKPYFRLANNDMVAIFRGEKFLEERYRKAKAFKAQQAAITN